MNEVRHSYGGQLTNPIDKMTHANQGGSVEYEALRGALSQSRKTFAAAVTTMAIAAPVAAQSVDFSPINAAICAVGETQASVRAEERVAVLDQAAVTKLFIKQLNEYFCCDDPSEADVLRDAALHTVRLHPVLTADFALGDEDIRDLRLLAASLVTQAHVERLLQGNRTLSNQFRNMVRHDDPMIREGVVYGLGRVERGEVVSTLKLFLNDKDVVVREAAEDELERRGEYA